MTETVAPAYSASLDAHERASRYIAGGVNSAFRSSTDPCPLTFTHASGSHLVDVDGTEYVDYALGMGPLILGHTPAAVIEAVKEAVVLGQLFAGQHPLESQLAELLVTAIPCADRVRFGQSGTEMDQLAIRLARAYTGRQRVIRFGGHYHGWLDPLYSLMPPNDDGSPRLSPGQSQAASRDVVVLPWNDLRPLEQMLGRSNHDVAAVLMEPILCNTGVILPRSGYLEGVRALCDRANVVLVFDEVITGFRVGLNGAQGLLGVRPDLATFAKAVASGYPVAAIAGRADIMDLLASGGVMHGGTYNTGLSAMAAGVATVRILVEDDPYPRLYRTGQELMAGIASAAETAGVEVSVEGLGPVFHTRFGPRETVTDLDSFNRNSSSSATHAFARALQDRAVRITPRGTWFLSTAHTADDIGRTIEAVTDAMRSLVRARVVSPKR